MRLLPRECPICGPNGDPVTEAEQRLDPTQLDAFAFASRKFPEGMHLRLRFCRVCGVLYADPAFPPQDLERGYQEAAYDSGLESHLAAKTYASFLHRFLDRLPSRRGALDIGTGDGAFLEELLATGFTEVQGIEPSKAPIAQSLPQIQPLIREGVFQGADFPEGRLALVTCFQTLEHLHDPLATCREVYRSLAPGGAFFTVVHNRHSWVNRVLGRRSPIYDLEHLQLFDPASAQNLFRAAGFVSIERRVLLNAYPLPYWLKLSPLPRAAKDTLIAVARRCGAGNLPLPFPAGNLAVVGYKPLSQP